MENQIDCSDYMKFSFFYFLKTFNYNNDNKWTDNEFINILSKLYLENIEETEALLKKIINIFPFIYYYLIIHNIFRYLVVEIIGNYTFVITIKIRKNFILMNMIKLNIIYLI